MLYIVLVDFKEKDETFEQKQEELRIESSVVFDKPSVIEEKYKEEYLSWKQKVAWSRQEGERDLLLQEGKFWSRLPAEVVQQCDCT